MKKFLLLFILGMMLIPTGCKKKNPAPPDPEPQISHDPIVADNAKVMDLDTRAAISNIDTVNFTFTFNGETDLLNNLKVGDILVDSCSDKAQYGYLRKVTSIEGAKGSKVVQTEQAKLFDVLHQGSIDFNSGKLTRNRISKMVLSKGVTLHQNKNTDFTVFDFDYEMELGDDGNKFTVEGNTSLSMDVFFDFDWHCDCLPVPDITVDKFETGIELNQSASLNLNSQAGASISTGNIKLASFYFQPWVFSIGPIPVVFVPKVDLILHADGTVSAQFSTGASENIDGRLGIKYVPSTTVPPLPPNSGWEPIAECPHNFNYYPPQLQLSANAEVHVGPEASLLLYGILGPFTNITGCMQLEASAYAGTNNWDMDFNVGSNAEVGVEITILNFEERASIEKCLFKENLIHLEDEPMGTGIFFEYPKEGNWYVLGSTMTIKARATGETPSRVDFILDGTLLASDSQEPYQYEWNTENSSYGEHTLIVNDVVDDNIISADTVTFSLLNAKWEVVDLSSFGQNNETINYDVLFVNDDNGWLAGGSAYGLGGYLLHTTDAGETWTTASPDDFSLSIYKMVFLGAENGNKMVVRTASNSVFEVGTWDREFGYPDQEGDWIVTFTAANVNDIALSPKGYIEALYHPYNVDTIYIARADVANHHFAGAFPIPYYDATPQYTGVPHLYFQNLKGIVYNLKTNSNPLKQYIMVTDNGGDSWNTKPLNASGITQKDNLYGAYFITEEHGWIVGHESQGFGVVLITNDGGDTWEKVNVENSYSLGSVQFISPTEGYATDNSIDMENDINYKLFHTVDGGYTWEPVEIVHTRFPMKKVNFLGPNLGYVVGQGSDTYRFTLGK